jgi:hypothetical protein
MGVAKEGGYILSATDCTLVIRHGGVDEETLKRVAEALRIPKAEQDKFISKTRSIYIYRK